ncbi:hypothetical protein Acsp06_20430 [Actinomycetospora sp. NBRC 106375]|uniref:DUF998 domain-containing protein n=1 Tax=Actinomycetospora sp. NBRC 106375 TaxID=3032207 RepID=UPI0024A2120D|nr:DUF998 domain-containing protein [Actinomycetospora sp. NBRC 106375]GLZ45858.1 hypothetical protein Acsp06_20430 [Actinomycetospora sp. NBRC 106375]
MGGTITRRAAETRRPPRTGLAAPAVVALALAAPVVLVLGGIGAQLAQPPGTYDAVGQTVSTLAGRGAVDRWIMATTLAVVGGIFVLVAAGLRRVPRASRLILGAGGVAVVVAALAAQPAHGSSVLHMTATATACGLFVLWPVPLALDRTLAARLRRDSLVAAAVMTLALAWLCAQAWTDGTWLGVAERVLILSQTVWPARVAVAAWRGPTRERPGTGSGAATLGLAVAAPVVLVAGLLAAQAAWPGPDAWDQSLSTLAGLGATNRWIMSSALGLVGVLLVLVAAGLRGRVPTPSWVVLAAGGALLVLAGLEPQPVGGYNMVHMATAGLAWAAFTLWPLGLAFSRTVDLRLRWASTMTVVVLVVLVGWFGIQLVTGGTWYGASQRIVVLAQAVWPIVVAAMVIDHRGTAA